MDNAVPAYHTHPLLRKLCDGFVIPTDSFLKTSWTNIEDVCYSEEHTTSLGANTFVATHPLSSEIQILELTPLVFENLLIDLGNKVFTGCSLQSHS